MECTWLEAVGFGALVVLALLALGWIFRKGSAVKRWIEKVNDSRSKLENLLKFLEVNERGEFGIYSSKSIAKIDKKLEQLETVLALVEEEKGGHYFRFSDVHSKVIREMQTRIDKLDPKPKAKKEVK